MSNTNGSACLYLYLEIVDTFFRIQHHTQSENRYITCVRVGGLYCAPTFQVESMPIPCGFHGFHMEFVWLRAQLFWRKFPCSFHIETPWNLNIPWNIPLESRWNGMESTTISSMESIWIPHIPHRFYSIPYGFHIFHMDSTYFIWIPWYSIQIPHGFISNI